MLDNLAEIFKTHWIPGSATFFVFGLLLAALLSLSGRRAAVLGVPLGAHPRRCGLPDQHAAGRLWSHHTAQHGLFPARGPGPSGS